MLINGFNGGGWFSVRECATDWKSGFDKQREGASENTKHYMSCSFVALIIYKLNQTEVNWTELYWGDICSQWASIIVTAVTLPLLHKMIRSRTMSRCSLWQWLILMWEIRPADHTYLTSTSEWDESQHLSSRGPFWMLCVLKCFYLPQRYFATH